MKTRFSNIKIHTVEPQGFDDHARSLQAGTRQSNKLHAGSVCDALLSDMPGKFSFEMNRDRLDKGLVVTDIQALDAVRFAFEELKLVLEPGGAVALAALMAAGKAYAGETILVVLSGGNVNPDIFNQAIAGQRNNTHSRDDSEKLTSH